MSRYVLAEFTKPEGVLEAARTLRKSGQTGLDTYSPYPLHGAEEALGLSPSRVPLIALVGGLAGVATGYGMQWWMNAVDYPINVGGRAIHSWQTNIPITFELGILFSVLAIFLGSMALFGFPQPYHPVFESEAFRSASLDRFWLSVEVDEAADVAALESRLEQLGAARVETVKEPR